LNPLDDDAMERFLGGQDPAPSPADRALLGRLAEGRPGRALGLLESDGLTLYRELMVLLQSLPTPDPARVHALAERLSRPAEEGRYRMAIELLQGILRRLTQGAAGLAAPFPDGAERALAERLAVPANLERWAGLWEKIQGLVGRADALQLDRRQVILTSFQALSGV
jgi:DNA polymerase-3 subunit delta'